MIQCSSKEVDQPDMLSFLSKVSLRSQVLATRLTWHRRLGLASLLRRSAAENFQLAAIRSASCWQKERWHGDFLNHGDFHWQDGTGQEVLGHYLLKGSLAFFGLRTCVAFSRSHLNHLDIMQPWTCLVLMQTFSSSCMCLRSAICFHSSATFWVTFELCSNVWCSEDVLIKGMLVSEVNPINFD